MEECKMSISITERDKKISQLQDIIHQKQQYILKKRKEIQRKKNINNLLSFVEDDYNKYFKYIKSDKEKQIQSMENIHKYLSELSKNEKMLDHQGALLKRDQTRLLEEISSIRDELSELVDEK
jgi:hypothetical protein